MNIATPGNTAELLRSHGLSARKKYGQNFLVDRSILEKIVDAAGVGEEDTVLEIGPGLGAMTQLLSERAKRVIAVEIDKQLAGLLKESLSDCENLTIINEDILKWDAAGYARSEGIDSYRVVANLPYYITTPILLSLLEGEAQLSGITVMVQKEVAERMQALPGTKEYGALSLAVQYRAKASVVCTVPPSCFLPRPAVDSAVIRLDVYPEPPVDCRDPEHMRRLIRAAFNQRRKTLANALSGDPALKLSRESVQKALQEMGLDELIRGERLSLEEYAKLSGLLKENVQCT